LCVAVRTKRYPTNHHAASNGTHALEALMRWISLARKDNGFGLMIQISSIGLTMGLPEGDNVAITQKHICRSASWTSPPR
jgi:hypothetical protein